MIKLTIFLLFFMLIIGLISGGEIRNKVDVFISGQDGVAFYRIPALVTSNKGTLIAICDARIESIYDAPNNIDLAMKRSFDNGKMWTTMKKILDYPGLEAAGDPCLLVDRETGTVWVFFDYIVPKKGFVPSMLKDFKIADDYDKWRTIDLYAMKSDNDGETWSEPINLSSVLKKAEWDYIVSAPGVGIQARNGRLLVPIYSSQDNFKTNCCHLIYSDDHGKTWNIGGSVGKYNVEPQVVELADGSLMMNMRQVKNMGYRMYSVSKDFGLTWSEVVNEKTLPEPGSGCQASFIRYTDVRDGYSKNRVLFSNPASSKGRVNMTVRVSYDEGKTWQTSKVLHKGPSAYSCLTVLSDETIGILYERGEKNLCETMTFERFNLEWLTDGKDK